MIYNSGQPITHQVNHHDPINQSNDANEDGNYLNAKMIANEIGNNESSLMTNEDNSLITNEGNSSITNEGNSSTTNEESLTLTINSIGVDVFKSIQASNHNVLISPISAFSSCSLIRSKFISDELVNEETISSVEVDEDFHFKFYNLKRRLESENNNKSYDLTIASQFISGGKLINSPLISGGKLINSPLISGGKFKEIAAFCHGVSFDTIDYDEVKSEIERKRGMMRSIKSSTREELRDCVYSSVQRLKTIDPINVLICTGYFKGTWIHAFDKIQVEKRTFYNLCKLSYNPITPRDGSLSYNPITVDFLCRWNHAYRISRPRPGAALDCDPKITTLLVPFKCNLTLIILMPSTRIDMHRLMQHLNGNFLTSIMNDTILTSLHLMAMPKFSLRHCSNLSDHFQETEGIKVSTNILHAAAIDFDETGTEAVPRTEIFKDRTKPSTNRPSIVIDRPFVFAVVENDSKLILFLGKIDQLTS